MATLHVPLVAMEGDMRGSILIEATDSSNKPIPLTLLHSPAPDPRRGSQGFPRPLPRLQRGWSQSCPQPWLLVGAGPPPQAEGSSVGWGCVLSVWFCESSWGPWRPLGWVHLLLWRVRRSCPPPPTPNPVSAASGQNRGKAPICGSAQPVGAGEGVFVLLGLLPASVGV